MMNLTSSLSTSPDNGQAALWAANGYVQMSIYDDLLDGEVTYNVHMDHLRRVNKIKVGDLVDTTEGDVALVVEWATKDMQGFDVYKVIVNGEEFIYSALELAIIGE